MNQGRAKMHLLPTLLLVACSTFSGATRLDEMSDAELARYTARTVAKVQVFADAAVREGDLGEDAALRVAQDLRAVADGTLVLIGAELVATLDLEGYGAAAMTLALIELDEALERAGAYEDGLLTERGAAVVRALAEMFAALEAP